MQPYAGVIASCIVMNAEAEEYELARRARGGDREALAELVARTRLRLFALAYAELRHYDDAHDAVAAALLRICLHVHELREPERVRAWMQSIVHNEARHLRRRMDASTTSLAETDGPTDDDGPSLLRLDIDRALRRLPGDQARAIRIPRLPRGRLIHYIPPHPAGAGRQPP
jgi:DNA-directed RNA polymerase specialized sigma24 family protein